MQSTAVDIHPDRPVKCLLIYPPFPENGYWNWKDVCYALDRKAMGIPLGLITFAALLPDVWKVRLIDLNTQELDEDSWQWADTVCVGGMITQQVGTFKIMQRARQDGKFLVVGGPDATSQPTVYEEADALVLGETETSAPLWLESCRAGRCRGKFHVVEKPDVTKSPIPRFDLLTIDDYLMLNVQFSRGCPFNCEFCDIIELYGRQPRTKTPEQLCRELAALQELGYRGWVDVVDDNFVGNKRSVKEMLPVLRQWSEARGFPFYFSTQASLNLADDEALMEAMVATDFRTVFLGIETPDPELLATTQKRMNSLKPMTDRIRKIYAHGMSITAGFILGFDGESEGAGDVIIQCIEENAIPVAMVSLLATLPHTQLSRRLLREGRLLDTATYEPIRPAQRHEVRLPVIKGELSDQATLGGLKFTTTRDRYQILEEHCHVWQTVYEPKRYFARVLRAATRLKARRKHRPAHCDQARFKRGFLKIVGQLLRDREVRWPLLLTLFRAMFLGLARFEQVARMVVAYTQFQKIRRRIAQGVPERIRYERKKGVPSMKRAAVPEPAFAQQRKQPQIARAG